MLFAAIYSGHNKLELNFVENMQSSKSCNESMPPLVSRKLNLQLQITAKAVAKFDI